ncbi:peptidoglycan DD-metalloendopeptidase family protein [Methyloprofundus sp.]|uniref:peptidoglycan DD-metalloendopeptidase family protein n=1 Tax=Methyloprofundus sp. TaxID=2020875 RepID=UPI003D11543A
MRYQNDLYKSTNPPQDEINNRSKHLFIAIVCALLIIISYIFFAAKPEQTKQENIALTIPDLATKIESTGQDESLITEIDTTDSGLIITASVDTPTHSMQSLSTIWHEHKVKSGESLSIIFTENQLDTTDLHKIIHANDISSKFATIQPGKSLLIGHDISGNFSHLIYKKSPYEELKATRLEDGEFKVELLEKELDRRINSASGIIHSSLFLDGQNAGLSNNIIMQLANIFAWDIDFALNLHEGDRFSVIYEKLYIDNTFIGPGKILAAEFINRGKSITAVRYQPPEGAASYYTSGGDSMRKAFLRTPIDFARISSHFNLKRKHPVLNRIRAHKGVDYAARTGTPIKSAGDGKITYRGRKGGYGRVVIVQHGQKYSTLYAHMSKFRKGQRVGSRVNQGQVIGYVGKSGLATGAHLHYEFRVNGVHRNPLTVTLPNANPIQAKYKADFLEKSKILLSQLAELTPTNFAATDTPSE